MSFEVSSKLPKSENHLYVLRGNKIMYRDPSSIYKTRYKHNVAKERESESKISRGSQLDEIKTYLIIIKELRGRKLSSQYNTHGLWHKGFWPPLVLNFLKKKNVSALTKIS